jgi:hypothetical protein
MLKTRVASLEEEEGKDKRRKNTKTRDSAISSSEW